MASFYESATSGLNFDRFVESAEGFPSSSSETQSINELKKKVTQKLWTAKHLFRTKVLGEREDNHLIESDKVFNESASSFDQICSTTKAATLEFEELHQLNMELRDCENDLAFILSEYAAQCDKEYLAKVVKLTATTLAASSKERQKLLKPVSDFYQELESYDERAISDCCSTMEAAEKARTEYRGSLLWMRNASEEYLSNSEESIFEAKRRIARGKDMIDLLLQLDPGNMTQMDEFRHIQSVVRTNKEKFDQLKQDAFKVHKVGLLEDTRSIIMRASLAAYGKGVLGFYDWMVEEFYEPTALESTELSAVGTYEIDILKILNSPVGLALKKTGREGVRAHTTLSEGAGEERLDGAPGSSRGKEGNSSHSSENTGELSLEAKMVDLLSFGDSHEDTGGGIEGDIEVEATGADQITRPIEKCSEVDPTHPPNGAAMMKPAPTSSHLTSRPSKVSLTEELERWLKEAQEERESGGVKQGAKGEEAL